MNKLTRQEKEKLVKKLYRGTQFSFYEIAQEAQMTGAGVQRVLNGTSKRPREETLDRIIFALEKLKSGKSVGVVINEPEEKYYTNNDILSGIQELKGIFIKNSDIFADALSEIFKNTESIKSDTQQISSSVHKLRTLIQKNNT